MKYIKKFDFFSLLERKNIGILYHVTSIQSLVSILKTNTIQGSDVSMDGGNTYINLISTTRNKSFLYDFRNKDMVAQIVLDGNMISDNYKIKSFDYWRGEHYIEGETHIEDEDEELIFVGSGGLKNITSYIVKVNLFSKGTELDEQSTEAISVLEGLHIPYDIVYNQKYKRLDGKQ
jgi:hypothetical protein